MLKRYAMCGVGARRQYRWRTKVKVGVAGEAAGEFAGALDRPRGEVALGERLDAPRDPAEDLLLVA